MIHLFIRGCTAGASEAKKKAKMVLPDSSIAAGHVITQCNTGRLPDGSAAAAVKR